MPSSRPLKNSSGSRYAVTSRTGAGGLFPFDLGDAVGKPFVIFLPVSPVMYAPVAVRTQGDYPAGVIGSGIRASPNVVRFKVRPPGWGLERRGAATAFTGAFCPPEHVDADSLAASVRLAPPLR